MTPDPSLDQELLRLLDGRVTAPERERLNELLLRSPEARARLRDLAEQAILIADVERATAHLPIRKESSRQARRPWLLWNWGLATAVLVAVLLGGWAWRQFRENQNRNMARVVKVAGAGSYLATLGQAEQELLPDTRLRTGDVIETRSCDSWIEIELRDGTHLTIAGQSALRVLEPESGIPRLHLLRGNLWSTPAAQPTGNLLKVQTPTAVLDARHAQFDAQATPIETILRVNQGVTRVTRARDGAVAEVPAGSQASITLTANNPFNVPPQPAPVTAWACNAHGSPEIILGRWLPGTALAPARLAAVPLLWPIPDQPPLTLHVAGLSVLRTGGSPVLLQANSRILFRGQTDRPQTVRFGFSTQRMRGVFAGKFELDVPAPALGTPGQPWEINRPIGDFLPIQPHLAQHPAGLELYDLYALTLHEDAGLEIHHVEVVPAP